MEDMYMTGKRDIGMYSQSRPSLLQLRRRIYLHELRADASDTELYMPLCYSTSRSEPKRDANCSKECYLCMMLLCKQGNDGLWSNLGIGLGKRVPRSQAS